MISRDENGNFMLDERMVRQLIQPGALQLAPTTVLRAALAFMGSRDESADDPKFRQFAADARAAIKKELERRGEKHGK